MIENERAEQAVDTERAALYLVELRGAAIKLLQLVAISLMDIEEKLNG
jgi:hypothetical protein